ncbi:MAG: DUF4012 domain-containing protein [Patescibacteria group bacterium]
MDRNGRKNNRHLQQTTLIMAAVRKSKTKKTKAVSLKKTAKKRVSKKTQKDLSLTISAPKSKKIISNLIVRTAEAETLSPYVVYLSTAQEQTQQIPQDTLESTINLLSVENNFEDEDLWDSGKTQFDLELTKEEITKQLSDEHKPAIKLPILKQLPVNIFPTETTYQENNEANQELVASIIQNQDDVNMIFDIPEDDEEYVDNNNIIEEIDGCYVLNTNEDHSDSEQPFAINSPIVWKRTLATFVAICVLVVLPFQALNFSNKIKETKETALFESNVALAYMQSATNSALAYNPPQAAQEFSKANKKFSAAKQTINELGSGTSMILSAMPVSGSYVKTAKSLVQAGESLSLAGSKIAQGFSTSEIQADPTPTSRLNILREYIISALPHLILANEQFKNVDVDFVPQEHQNKLVEMKNMLPPVISSLNEFVILSQPLLNILGDNQTKKYLIVFQNNTEIRPTGGFMGSFAEISLKDGKIENIRMPGGGTYDLQGSLQDFITAPKPLQLLNARWEFQDANWFPDFPTSSKQILDFYQSAGQPTVDGVIAINATYVADLLTLFNPFEMPEYGRTIDSENFLFETQKIVELEYDKQENQPKAFLSDLAPKILEEVESSSAEQYLKIVEHLLAGLSKKDIQIYFTDNTLEKEVINHGWAGQIHQTDGDYLMIVDTNLGGGKTDSVIKQEAKLQVDISEDGTITNTITVERSHFGYRGSLFDGVNNVDYVRVYVPKGSKLLKADGFEIPDSNLFDEPDPEWIIDDDLKYRAETASIDPESRTNIEQALGKTIFGNWVQTKPGTTSKYSFTYELPFKAIDVQTKQSFFEKIKIFIGFPETSKYSLLLQKQSGILDRSIVVTINIPESMSTLWSSHDIQNTLFTNDQDALFSILLEKN